MVLSTRLGEFSAEALNARQAGQGHGPNAISALLHGCASLLYALAAANLPQPPPEAAIEQLLLALQDSGFDPMPLSLPRLTELSWSVQALLPANASAQQLVEGCTQAMRYRASQLSPQELPGVLTALEVLGKFAAPAMVFVRERQIALSETISSEIANARDEACLLDLLRTRPINASQVALRPPHPRRASRCGVA